jgi:hypothetical protein
MINKKTGVWLAAGTAVVLVAAGAVAVAAADWGGGSGEQVREAPAGRTAARGNRSSSRSSSSLYLLRFDANRDGRITRAEVEAGIVAEFRGIDSNQDGRLDATEYQAYENGRRAARRAWRAAHPNGDGGEPSERVSNWDPMKRLDWNLDGYVTMEEFGGRTRANAMRADRDGDGTILVEDLKRPRARSRRTAASR